MNRREVFKAVAFIAIGVLAGGYSVAYLWWRAPMPSTNVPKPNTNSAPAESGKDKTSPSKANPEGFLGSPIELARWHLRATTEKKNAEIMQDFLKAKRLGEDYEKHLNYLKGKKISWPTYVGAIQADGRVDAVNIWTGETQKSDEAIEVQYEPTRGVNAKNVAIGSPLILRGEITRWHIATSGALVFSLKDASLSVLP